MIFVIVAILILIVSFIIALTSLIKEQSKQAASANRQSLPSLSADFSKQNGQTSTGHELPHVTKDQVLVNEASVQSIAELEQRLAEYKLQKQQKVAKENIDNSTKEVGDNQNLSGEFLLSDLK